MAETQNDGGQAFPQPVTVGPNDDLYPAYPGMSLRDWFAGQAIGTVMEVCRNDTGIRDELQSGGNVSRYFARKAYQIADAMLAERAKPLPTPSDE